MALTLDPAELTRFIALTETKISPKQVGKLYARAEMLAKLPCHCSGGSSNGPAGTTRISTGHLTRPLSASAARCGVLGWQTYGAGRP